MKHVVYRVVLWLECLLVYNLVLHESSTAPLLGVAGALVAVLLIDPPGHRGEADRWEPLPQSHLERSFCQAFLLGAVITLTLAAAVGWSTSGAAEPSVWLVATAPIAGLALWQGHWFFRQRLGDHYFGLILVIGTVFALAGGLLTVVMHHQSGAPLVFIGTAGVTLSVVERSLAGKLYDGIAAASAGVALAAYWLSGIYLVGAQVLIGAAMLLFVYAGLVYVSYVGAMIESDAKRGIHGRS